MHSVWWSFVRDRRKSPATETVSGPLIAQIPVEDFLSGNDRIMSMKFTIQLCLFITLCLTATAVYGQVDPFGELDKIWIDNAEASAGETFTVSINLENDEVVGSVSVPITYDPAYLTLLDISFENSIAEHLANKITNPVDVTTSDGHFLVALIRIFEDPMPIGGGLLFTATFRMSDTATPGVVTVLDTLFYPPGGRLQVDEATTGESIFPEFTTGSITVDEANRPPAFSLMSDVTSMEGDEISVLVKVNDPDLDNVTIASTAKPTGAQFVDNGDGTGVLTWVPDYVGPYSSVGSPFHLGFWATDGNVSVERQIELNVINSNRPPVITDPGEQTVQAGELFSVNLHAIDPDFENVTWVFENLPEGATVTSTNPATLSWQSNIDDTGNMTMSAIASDPGGLADTQTVTLAINPATLYSLSIDTMTAYPGESVTVGVTLKNELPVTGFELVVSYDVSAMYLNDISNEGTLSESLASFNVTENVGGLQGYTQITGQTASGVEMAPDSGLLVEFEFTMTSNLAFAGMSIPVRFVTILNPQTYDNVLYDTLGATIERDAIEFSDGYVNLHDIEVNIGDINLNGVAAEISDVIYFTNHFINPVVYTFTVQQYANSDINEDNIPATISDLVTLINMVVGKTVTSSSAGNGTASLDVAVDGSGGTFSINSDDKLGGVFVEFVCDRTLSDQDFIPGNNALDFLYHQRNDTVRVIGYSLDGRTLPSGATDLFAVAEVADLEVVRAEASSTDGVLMSLQFSGVTISVPDNYTLSQNYPNPFNPETTIEFSLPTASEVELKVYNILGHEVKTLAQGFYSAGPHRVVWDGSNDAGSKVASGIYLYRLSSSEFTDSKKMLLLK